MFLVRLAGMEARRGSECRRARGFGMGERAREEVDGLRHDDQWNSGQAPVENASVACVEHGRSQYHAVITG